MISGVKRRILLGFLLALTVVGAVAFLLFHSASEFQSNRQQVRATRACLDALQDVLSSMVDVETGERGFVLTGNPSYLEPYDRGRASIGERFNRLQSLLSASASSQQAVGELHIHIQKQLEQTNELVALRRAGSLDSALSVSELNASKVEMDAIRSSVANLQDHERRALESGRQRYEASLARTGRLFAGAFAFLLLVLALLLVFIYRDAHSREKTGLELLRERLQLGAILNTISEGLCQLDRQGQLLYLNPAGEKLLGYALDDLRGKSFHEVVHASLPGGVSCSAVECLLHAVVQSGATRHSEHDSFRRKDDSFLSVEYTSSPLVIGGELVSMVLSFRDITDRKRFEDALRDSEERYRNLVEQSRGLICTHDLSGTLLSVNEAAAEALGRTPSELIGRNLSEILAPAFREQFDWYLRAVSEWGGHSGIMRVVNKDGEELFWSYSNRLVTKEGSVPYVLGNGQDVTGQVRAEQALKASEKKLKASLESEKNLSRSDFLTKVSNRRHFFELLDAEARRSRRYKRPITIAYVDLDHFKRVNDELGHQSGDEVLVSVAGTIQATIRNTDTVARLGGDEFALLLPETDSSGASVITDKVRAALLELAESRGWNVGFSMGVVTFAVALESAQEMVQRADELMYQVKHSGKNAVASLVV